MNPQVLIKTRGFFFAMDPDKLYYVKICKALELETQDDWYQHYVSLLHEQGGGDLDKVFEQLEIKHTDTLDDFDLFDPPYMIYDDAEEAEMCSKVGEVKKTKSKKKKCN